MMMDMPSALVTPCAAVNWGSVAAATEEYSSFIAIVRQTWSAESLQDILAGHVAVPDDEINRALAEQLADNDQVKALSITSHENGRLDIHADTAKIGRIELSGTMDAFVHDGDHSYMTYTIKERALKDHGLLSWFFSRISLSMAEKLTGRIELAEDLPTKIHGNTITVDFSERLRNSRLAQASYDGFNLLDALVISRATPHDGYVELDTELRVPDALKTLLKNILQ